MLFEILVLTMAQNMDIRPLVQLLDIYPDSLWRIISHYFDQALQSMSLEQVGIDEVAIKKGHEYLTVFVDLAVSRIIFLAAGRDTTVIDNFHDFLVAKGIKPQQVSSFRLSIWSAYLKGLGQHFKDSGIIFDRYRLMAKGNAAVEMVRRQEAKERKEL